METYYKIEKEFILSHLKIQKRIKILLVDAIDDKAIYQLRRKYVRKNKSKVILPLTANQGEGGHNVCIIKGKHGLRKMTPRECFSAQGFPKKFKLSDETSDAKLYKQAGNSVCAHSGANSHKYFECHRTNKNCKRKANKQQNQHHVSILVRECIIFLD